MKNHLCHAATAADGRFVVLRVLKVAQEGQRHLDILRYIARGRRSLYHYNHALPLLQEIHFEDITFGVFPCVGQGVREAYNHWAKNSVYDLVDIILQMLEVSWCSHGCQCDVMTLRAGTGSHSLPPDSTSGKLCPDRRRIAPVLSGPFT